MPSNPMIKYDAVDINDLIAKDILTKYGWHCPVDNIEPSMIEEDVWYATIPNSYIAKAKDV